jgi:hypothetical protein
LARYLRTCFDYAEQIRRDLRRYTEFDANGASLEQATREEMLSDLQLLPAGPGGTARSPEPSR